MSPELLAELALTALDGRRRLSPSSRGPLEELAAMGLVVRDGMEFRLSRAGRITSVLWEGLPIYCEDA